MDRMNLIIGRVKRAVSILSILSIPVRYLNA
jgi:hypothetical protein